MQKRTELTEEEIQEIYLRLESKMIVSLEDFFKVCKIDYKNLNEFLGLSSKALTQLKKNPREKGTLDLLLQVSEMSGIRASVIMDSLGFGKAVITVEEKENIIFEETLFVNRA